MDEARARAGRLKAALENRNVHAEVLHYCRAELLDENYFHAVFESTKGVAERIRSLPGLTTDGSELVNRAFSTQNPILVLGSLATESEKSEQKASPIYSRAFSVPCAIRLLTRPKITGQCPSRMPSTS